MRQNKLTLIVPIIPGAESDRKALLSTLGETVTKNTDLLFSNSPSTHFVRFVIFDREKPARLLFSSCYSGTLKDYAAELVNVTGAGLDKVFKSCEGYSPGTWLNASEASHFCWKHDEGADFFVVAFPDATVPKILASRKLRSDLNDLLDTKSVQALVESLYPGGLKLPQPKVSRSNPNTPFKNFLDSLLVKPMPKNSNTILKTRPEVRRMEDRVVQNELTTLSNNKPGWHRILLRGVLLGAKLTSYISSPLGGLPMIHFAQWTIIDGGKHLLFESNYDGTWEKYIDDFIDNSFLGLDSIWGQSIEYPAGGARNAEAFKKGIRDFQYSAQYFYSAYPDSSVQNIYDDLALSRAVSGCVNNLAVRRFISGTHSQSILS